MNPILLSTVLLISFLYVSNCAPQDQQKRDYYEYYADAVNHYYREPRSPERAIAVLREACRRLKDRRDVSCYNLGVILENEKRPREALQAYRRAYQLRRHPLYREAVQSLAPSPGDYSTAYFQGFRRMSLACQNEDPATALKEMQELILAHPPATDAEAAPDADAGPDRTAETAATNQGPVSENLHRAIFAQPIFQACLGDNSEYRAMLKRLPEQTNDLKAQSVHFRARNDPYHTLWDMELHLLRLTRSRDSKHPVTVHWQGVLGSRGSGARAAGHLTAFFEELDRVAAAAPATQQPDIETRVLAMKRAAAVLLDRDPFFGGLGGNGRVRALIRPYLKP